VCGRYGYDVPELTASRFQAELLPDVTPDILVPRYNIAPTQPVLAVATSKRLDGRRGVRSMVWGLTQQWALNDGKKPRPINLQAESLLERPTYSRLLAQKRCLIPASHFYE